MRLRDLLQATPGRRFIERYRHHRHSGAAWRKPLAMIAGAALIILGALLILTPGPGMLITVAGAMLVASESERAARMFDRLELRLRAAWRGSKGSGL